MYYYAYIDIDTGFCHDVVESDVPIEDPYYIELSGFSSFSDYFKYYRMRKTYENGEWRDTTVEEAESYNAPTVGEHTAIGGEWLDVVLDEKADIEHTHEEYASSNHIHTEYASSDDLQVLEDVIDTKADSNHSHTEYATSTHEHENYAEIGHNHNSDYAPLSHSHVEYATTSSLNELSTTVSGKADASHTHDDRFYTETEIDTKLVDKADSSHTHTGVYDVSGAAASALSSANTYTDSKIDALVGEGASTTLDTIGEISSAIEENQDAIDLLNTAIGNKANVSDLTSHTSNKSNPHSITLSQLGVTATTTELNYVDGVISNIQTQLNNKAASSHNHSGVYANASHTHTATAVGAVATSDIATVSEVETYLGI